MEIDSDHDVADRTYNSDKQIPADHEHAFYNSRSELNEL